MSVISSYVISGFRNFSKNFSLKRIVCMNGKYFNNFCEDDFKIFEAIFHELLLPLEFHNSVSWVFWGLAKILLWAWHFNGIFRISARTGQLEFLTFTSEGGTVICRRLYVSLENFILIRECARDYLMKWGYEMVVQKRWSQRCHVQYINSLLIRNESTHCIEHLW